MENNPNVFEIGDNNALPFTSYVKSAKGSILIIVNVDGEEFQLKEINSILDRIETAPVRVFSDVSDMLIRIKAITTYDDEGFVTRDKNFDKLKNRLAKIVAVG